MTWHGADRTYHAVLWWFRPPSLLCCSRLLSASVLFFSAFTALLIIIFMFLLLCCLLLRPLCVAFWLHTLLLTRRWHWSGASAASALPSAWPFCLLALCHVHLDSHGPAYYLCLLCYSHFVRIHAFLSTAVDQWQHDVASLGSLPYACNMTPSTLWLVRTFMGAAVCFPSASLHLRTTSSSSYTLCHSAPRSSPLYSTCNGLSILFLPSSAFQPVHILGSTALLMDYFSAFGLLVSFVCVVAATKYSAFVHAVHGYAISSLVWCHACSRLQQYYAVYTLQLHLLLFIYMDGCLPLLLLPPPSSSVPYYKFSCPCAVLGSHHANLCWALLPAFSVHALYVPFLPLPTSFSSSCFLKFSDFLLCTPYLVHVHYGHNYTLFGSFHPVCCPSVKTSFLLIALRCSAF